MKKVVVVFPYPPSADKLKFSFGKKIFETKCEEEYLEAINKPDGCLVITCNAQLPRYKPRTLAVFKEWIYWEPVKDK